MSNRPGPKPMNPDQKVERHSFTCNKKEWSYLQALVDGGEFRSISSKIRELIQP